MERYEIDEYVHEEFLPGHVNLGCVFSLLHRNNAQGEDASFAVERYNEWEVLSEQMTNEQRERVMRRVREIESWRTPIQITDLVISLGEADSPLALKLANSERYNSLLGR
jgi:hypothetical protein